MNNDDLSAEFLDWLDKAFIAPPEGIIAFNINLYDCPFKADLVGSEYYDPKDPNWACEEHWVANPRFFDFPDGFEQRPWKERQEWVHGLLTKWVNGDGPVPQAIRSVSVVTVGFVDGDLIVVHERGP